MPRSAAWKRAPSAAIHGTHSAERAATSARERFVGLAVVDALEIREQLFLG